MAEVTITGGGNSPLMDILGADDLQPGSELSYQTAKTIYAYHPLGAKLAEKPIRKAQSQQRELTGIDSPDDRVRIAFWDEWAKICADKNIFNTMRLSRVYGVASCAALDGGDPAIALNLEKLAKGEVTFNVLDPLNTSGSFVASQDPNSPNFMKHLGGISVAGVAYHPSRVCVILNEEPIYIQYTSSGFGYVGRSVYQRPLYLLKSFIEMMIANNMIAQKLGLLIAKQKQAGSIVDRLMIGFAGIKRAMLQGGKTGNVMSIDVAEDIETLNMMNVDGAGKFARDNILHDIAAAAGMPAMMVNDETFAEGFGEGSEDAKDVAEYVGGVRADMQPLYAFFDRIVQYRAWTEEFYATLQADYPEEFGSKPYKTAFFEWVNGFKADWPSLLIEPESERSKSEKVILDALIEVSEVLLPALDPENKATMIGWLADNLNEKKLLFSSPLVLDLEALAAYVPPVAGSDEDEDEPSLPKAKAGKK